MLPCRLCAHPGAPCCRLNFHKNAAGEYECPVLNKVGVGPKLVLDGWHPNIAGSKQREWRTSAQVGMTVGAPAWLASTCVEDLVG